MKKISKIMMLLLACLLIVGITDVEAQYGKKKKKKTKEKVETEDDYFDESGGKFTDKLWYGGMVNFQISGDNFGTILLAGISPMVGYKINDIFSIGPRATLNYVVYYQDGPNPKFIEWGIGGFGRAKIYNSIFAHVEYSFEALSQVSGADQRLDDGTNFYIGGGYNSGFGGGLGYEILVLYNTTEENERIAPLEYRVGFTWNF